MGLSMNEPVRQTLCPAIPYAVMQRLRFIDFLMAHYGEINRSAVVNYFGVSHPTASNDFKLYMNLAPNNMAYDAQLKSYRRSPLFKQVWL